MMFGIFNAALPG
jgi:hypothetical protein